MGGPMPFHRICRLCPRSDIMFNSRSGSYYASTAKLLNCLVGFLLMATMAFAAIPYFLVSQSKATIAAHPKASNPNEAKFTEAKTKAHPAIFYASKPYLQKASTSEGKLLTADHGGLAQIQTMKLKSRSLAPKKFEVNESTEKKRGKPNAM